MMSYHNNEHVRGANFFELKIYTDNNNLKEILKKKATEANKQFHNSQFPNAGFDLPVPRKYTIDAQRSKCLDHDVKCAMFHHSYKDKHGPDTTPVSYYLYPRSSTGTRTKLRLANSVGIIDSGYRGTIIAAFDNISDHAEVININSHLVQICSPTLEPFMISIADTIAELGTTERGEGNFGSTGM